MPRSWVGIVLTILLLVGWGCSWWVLYDRHGLPAEVPLPEGVIYQSANPLIFNHCGCCPSCRQETIGTIWLWTSSDPPAVVQQFYLSQLQADHQWGSVSLLVGEPGVGAINLRTGKGMDVMAASSVGTVRAPPGGSVIRVSYYRGTTITP